MTKNNKDSIFKNSALISILVLFGKVLGFVKQSIIAWAFGATGITDVYFAADGFTSVFGEIIKSSIAPTVLTRYVKNSPNQETERSKQLVRECVVFFGVLGLCMALLSVFFAPIVCNIIGLSYNDSQKSDLVFYLRVLAPTLIFTSLAGVAQGYLDANKRYIPAKLCSYFFSICIILGIVLLKDKLGVRSLLYGFVAGYGLHTIYMFYLLVHGVGMSIVNPFRDFEFRLLLKHFFPLLIGTSVVDIGHLVDKIVASALITGSLSVLYYGQVVSNDIVNAVLITSLGTVLLPTLTRSVSNNENASVIKSKIQNIIIIISIITGLLSVLYLIEGLDLVRFFFERGSFNANDSYLVNSVVSFYSIGFVFMAQREVLVKAHYAFQDTLTPMINSVVGVLVNIFGSIILSRVIGVSGIALATSISMIVVSVISWITIRKHTVSSIMDKEMIVEFVKVSLGIAITIIFGKSLLLILAITNAKLRMCIIGFSVTLFYFLFLLTIKEQKVNSYFRTVIRKIFSR